jgi:hypothetical protein
MHEVRWRENSHLQPCCRDEFQAPRGAIVRGYRAARGIVLPGHVIAELLDQDDMSCDKGGNKMRLARTGLVHCAHPGVHPIVMVLATAAGWIALIRAGLTNRSGA